MPIPSIISIWSFPWATNMVQIPEWPVLCETALHSLERTWSWEAAPFGWSLWHSTNYLVLTTREFIWKEENIGSWMMWKTGMRWENAGYRSGQWQSVTILNSRVLHTMWTPLQISTLATSSPPLSPPSLATHTQDVRKCVLSRQHGSQKPSCTPMGGGEHLKVQHSEETPSLSRAVGLVVHLT